MATASRGRTTEQSQKSPGRDRPNTRGDATRLRLLLTAEQLFAERGIAAVPLRDIGAAAGQKNNVAVQYHFQDRDTLLQEIILHRAQASEKKRAELLAGLLAEGRPPGVHDVVEVYIRSLDCHLEPGNNYLAFLSRYVTERGGYAGLEGLSVGGLTLTFTAMLRRMLPNLPEPVLDERWTLFMTSVVHALARYQLHRQSGSATTPLPVLLDDLVRFFTAALEAPYESATPR